MAPRHTQGFGGQHFLRQHISLVLKKPRIGVFVFFFPPPAYAGIRPTLFLFGFQTDALNSHFSLNNYPKERPAANTASDCLRRAGAYLSVMGFVFFWVCWDLKIQECPGHLQGRPGQWPPERPAEDPQHKAGFKGLLGGAPAPA